MSGEGSKFSGEFGEKIVDELFKLIGWKKIIKGQDIDCINDDIHKGSSGNPRKTHGVDFIVKYVCPLVSRSEAHILVSAKHRKSYPETQRGKTTDFKSYLKDIAEATECYPSHNSYLESTPGTKSKEISNVIMWFNGTEGSENESVINDIQNFRNNENVNYKTVYLVDNKKANFLYSSIKYVQSIDPNYKFFYPDTGFNMDTFNRHHQGQVLPVQYINSPILLFKIVESDGKGLIIVTEEKFNGEYFERLLQLARLLTINWASKLIICFPNYNSYAHEEEVNFRKNKIEDNEFIEQISVKKFSYLDFRNLGGEL